MSELKLRLYIEENAERTIIVSQKEFIIGRLPECDLCLSFSEVSRYHARISQIKNDDWFIEDLGSTNGTLINQFPITSEEKLNDGDLIQIGNVSLSVTFVIPHRPKVTHIDNQIDSNSESTTILRSAEEMQQQWIKVDVKKGTLATHKTAISRLKDLVKIAKGLNLAESSKAIFNQVKEVVFKEISTIDRLALLVDIDSCGKLELLNVAAKNFSSDNPIVKDTSWISNTICQRAFIEKVSIKCIDAQTDDRFEGEKSILAKGISSVLAVPLWDENQVFGVLYADAHINLQNPELLDEEDLSFFSTLANLVASSVQRWLLTRKLQGEAAIRHKLERYHSPAVVQQLISVGALENDRITPTEADISILFADLVGFTTLSERLSASEIARLLNRLFEEMLHSVFEAGGTLDKFIGDCIMAFFGAPEPQKDHPERAIAAAIGMLERLDQLNAQKVWSQPLKLRIAINSGKAVVGDVGSSQRVDYTVLGTTVNLASRMEAICPPGECVISEATYQRLPDKTMFTPMRDGRFKGIDRPVKIYRTNRYKD